MEHASALSRPPTPADYTRLLDAFPDLGRGDWEITSDNDPGYNCIAFAAGENHVPWWPLPFPVPGCYWPPGVPSEVTLKNFVLAFRTLGYRVCQDGRLEEGYEKIVIFTKTGTPEGEPTHAAIQIASGAWKSKLGDYEDIQHATPEAVINDTYGKPVRYMKRRLAGHQRTPPKTSPNRGRHKKSR